MAERAEVRLIETTPTTADQVIGNTTRRVEDWHANAAVTAGDWVELDPTGTERGLGGSVITSTGVDELCIGVSLTTVAAAGIIDVVVYGLAQNAAVATGTAAGALLQTSAVAGRAEAAGAVTQRVVGQCLELAAANIADVFVKA